MSHPGGPEVLELKEVPDPKPKKDWVLIQFARNLSNCLGDSPRNDRNPAWTTGSYPGRIKLRWFGSCEYRTGYGSSCLFHDPK